MSKKQSSIEWLKQRVLYIVPSSQKDDLIKLFEQAEDMRKAEIEKAYEQGEEEADPFKLPKALPDDVFYESLEPKQEQEVCNHCGGDGIYITADSERVECPMCEKGKVPKEEAKQRAANYMSLKGALEPKQETLEEAAEKEFPLLDTKWCRTGACEEENLHLLGHRRSFIKGAKWQQERSYNEEEVLLLLQKLAHDVYINQWNSFEKVNTWFEQFKKK